MYKSLILLGLLLWVVTPAKAELSIGIRLSLFPQLVMVPGYPVYYAPDLDSNYFFYDGAYWVYESDNWYSSSWYDGPWELMDPVVVPLYVLRVPVRYYRQPPRYFRGWQGDAAPRWGEHWGSIWSERRSGWDHWDRQANPAPAPLPVYQRQYYGAHYPPATQQRALQKENYNQQSAPSPRSSADRGADASRSDQHDRAPPPPQAQPPHQQPGSGPQNNEQKSPERHSPQQPAREQPQPAQKSANENVHSENVRAQGAKHEENQDARREDKHDDH